MRISVAIPVTLIGLLAGFGVGCLVGQKRGERRGIALGTFKRAKIECVYLTLSFRNENRGDDVGAQDLRYRLLYGAAQELDSIASDEEVSKEQQDEAFGIVRDVVNHYRLHPDSTSFLERSPFLDEFVRPELEDFFESYPPP